MFVSQILRERLAKYYVTMRIADEKEQAPAGSCLQGLCYLFPTSLEGRTEKGILLHGDLLAVDNVDAGNEFEGHGLASLHELGCDCCACCGDAEALAAGGYAVNCGELLLHLVANRNQVPYVDTELGGLGGSTPVTDVAGLGLTVLGTVVAVGKGIGGYQATLADEGHEELTLADELELLLVGDTLSGAYLAAVLCIGTLVVNAAPDVAVVGNVLNLPVAVGILGERVGIPGHSVIVLAPLDSAVGVVHGVGLAIVIPLILRRRSGTGVVAGTIACADDEVGLAVNDRVGGVLLLAGLLEGGNGGALGGVIAGVDCILGFLNGFVVLGHGVGGIEAGSVAALHLLVAILGDGLVKGTGGILNGSGLVEVPCYVLVVGLKGGIGTLDAQLVPLAHHLILGGEDVAALLDGLAAAGSVVGIFLTGLNCAEDGELLGGLGCAELAVEACIVVPVIAVVGYTAVPGLACIVVVLEVVLALLGGEALQVVGAFAGGLYAEDLEVLDLVNLANGSTVGGQVLVVWTGTCRCRRS